MLSTFSNATLISSTLQQTIKMSSTCGFPLCQPKQRIQQPCPKHAPAALSHFCANQACLEMLCVECLKQHQEGHQHIRTTAKICQLVQMEQYYEKVTEKQLDYEMAKSNRQKGIQAERRVDPCEVLCEYVDQYFYGSTENKVANLKTRKQALEKPNTKTFIDIVERSSHYKIEENFKERYFAFLDSLMERAISQ